MELKVGKIYENRKGGLVKITHIKKQPSSLYMYVGVFYDRDLGKNVTEYFSNKGYRFSKGFDPYLIEEVDSKEIEIL